MPPGMDKFPSEGLKGAPSKDIEEEKAQEIAMLQDALHAMQLQVEEANERVKKEQEATWKAIEEAPPTIKETPVIV
ncbi:hypothetical protein V6N11_013726 [Hibiscus sabdariffa]|uniref:Uncharacterized protein n=1 Tax=Hibiscus sabdariffa TaxID=183260 RepID=A0ABR2PCR4_9ROSI